jgi:hypothetical protein
MISKKILNQWLTRIASLYDQYGIYPLISLALAMAIYYQPIGAQLFPGRRAEIWQGFLSVPQKINSRTYWKLREALGPGTLTYDKDVVAVRQILYINSPPTPLKPLTTFKSSTIQAEDFLLTPDRAQQQLTQAIDTNNKVIFKSAEMVIFQDAPRTYKLVAEFNLEELYQTHGLFDFEQPERQRLQGLVWFSRATITL